MAVTRKMCRPHELNGRDWFIKDPIFVQGPLQLGALRGNHFKIRLTVPGMNSQSISSYLNEKVAILEERNWMFPNACGETAPRSLPGRTTTSGTPSCRAGPLTAFRMCLTLGAPDESDFAKDVRAALAKSWEEFEQGTQQWCTNRRAVLALRRHAPDPDVRAQSPALG